MDPIGCTRGATGIPEIHRFQKVNPTTGLVGILTHAGEIAGFAAGDEAFGDGFQCFPTFADGSGFVGIDGIVGGGAGDDSEEIR